MYIRHVGRISSILYLTTYLPKCQSSKTKLDWSWENLDMYIINHCSNAISSCSLAAALEYQNSIGTEISLTLEFFCDFNLTEDQFYSRQKTNEIELLFTLIEN